MRFRVIAVALAMMATTATVADAADSELIEPVVTGGLATFAMPGAQSFTPTISGVVREVTLWTLGSPAGRDGELTFHLGDRPGVDIHQSEFVWTGSPTTVTLTPPLSVTAGQPYTLQVTGVPLATIVGTADPYPNGEFVLATAAGWVTWSEWRGPCTGACLVLDQRFSLEVVSADADGDGVLDTDDLCADTVLPDPSTEWLRRGRYGATTEGIMGIDGTAIASLADTGGCSTAQIVAAYGLGEGHLRFGLTRPHVERWVADVLAR